MPLTDPFTRVQNAANRLNALTSGRPAARTAIVLGSGLGDSEWANSLSPHHVVPFESLPDFPGAGVDGHVGRFMFLQLNGEEVIIQQGRPHFYEGHSMEDIGLPVRVLKKLGVENLVLTNAAGAVNKDIKPGHLVSIIDHINLMGKNPLRGPNDERIGTRFPDLSYLYNLSHLVHIAVREAEIERRVHGGTYAAMSGPTYETSAEVRMIRAMGGDMVGMSTVPEALFARHCGIPNIAGISIASNPAAGIEFDLVLIHEDVKQVVGEAAEDVGKLLEKLVCMI